MASNTYPLFFESAYLASSNAGIYTVPDSPTTTILQQLTLKCTNVTAATRVVTIYASTSGAQGANNAIALNMSVPPYDYIEIPVPRIAAGGAIEGFCDAENSVTVQAIGGKLHVP